MPLDNDLLVTRIEQVNTNLIYEGRAKDTAAGTDDAVWQLRRIAISSGVTVSTYAGDGEFGYTWDDRATTFGDTPVPAATTITRVSSSATSTQLLAADPERKGAILYNDSTEDCYVKFGTTATTTSFSVRMAAYSILALEDNPIYKGRIDGIWDSADGAMQITEIEE